MENSFKKSKLLIKQRYKEPYPDYSKEETHYEHLNNCEHSSNWSPRQNLVPLMSDEVAAIICTFFLQVKYCVSAL